MAILMLGRLKNVFLVLSKPQSQFGCQISNHFQKSPMDSWSLVSTFWSQCINSRHNTQSNTHNTWFLKHLCCFVAFRLKSFQHDMHRLTGSSASGLELVDLIYWQSDMLGDSSQTGRMAGRLLQPRAKPYVAPIQKVPPSHLKVLKLHQFLSGRHL